MDNDSGDDGTDEVREFRPSQRSTLSDVHHC